MGLGALAILVPVAAGLAATVLLGWLLVVGGLAEAAHALVNRRWRGSDWAILGALVYVVAGAVVIAFPRMTKLGLTLVLTAFLIGDGALKIVRALQHRDLPAWRWLLCDGVLSFFLG